MPDGTTLEQPASDQAAFRLALYGHSHINGMVQGLETGGVGEAVVFEKVQLRAHERLLRQYGIQDEAEKRARCLRRLDQMIWRLAARPGSVRAEKIPAVAKQHNVLTVLSFRGVQHVVRGLPAADSPYDFVLPDEPDLPLIDGAEIVPYEMMLDYFRIIFAGTFDYIDAVSEHVRHNLYYVEMPAPYEDEDYIRSRIGSAWIGQQVGSVGLSPASLRYKLWRVASRVHRQHCEKAGVTFVPCPPATLTENGFLHPDAWHDDAVHGNGWFGARMVEAVIEADRRARSAPAAESAAGPAAGSAGAPVRAPRSVTPYQSQPPAAFWRRAISTVPGAQVDPVLNWSLKLERETRVATAGSCFAQHIANRLSKSGFNYFVTETAPQDAVNPAVARDYGYGVFSARYGNIYTSRQLVQLFDRAYGRFQPVEDTWVAADGRLIDPFRPNIQKGGFATRHEFDAARAAHFAAVRRMFEELEVFVFTLGLTEAWENISDGAIYPLCPGVAGGTYDPGTHRLHNLTAHEVIADLEAFLERLRGVNPASKVILTVSPVPLIATATDRHVLTATTYSKSVLRVAAEEVSRSQPEVHYFPSYEVITGAHSRGAYMGEDLREVEDAGVNHVMRLFFRHATTGAPAPASRAGSRPPESPASSARKAFSRALNIICDENSIEKHM